MKIGKRAYCIHHIPRGLNHIVSSKFAREECRIYDILWNDLYMKTVRNIFDIRYSQLDKLYENRQSNNK